MWNVIASACMSPSFLNYAIATKRTEVLAIIISICSAEDDIHPQFHVNPACLQLSHPNNDIRETYTKWSPLYVVLCYMWQQQRSFSGFSRSKPETAKDMRGNFSWNVHNAKEITVGNGNVTFLYWILSAHRDTYTFSLRSYLVVYFLFKAPSSRIKRRRTGSIPEEISATCWAFKIYEFIYIKGTNLNDAVTLVDKG